MANPDGGPAFPEMGISFQATGMTLRDYVAAQVLPTLIQINFGRSYTNAQKIAAAFVYADEFIKQSQESEPSVLDMEEETECP